MAGFMFSILGMISATVIGVSGRQDHNQTSRSSSSQVSHASNVSTNPAQYDLTQSGLATTTLYYDNSGGACGCFDKKTKEMFRWQTGSQRFYTAAASEALYDPYGDKSWCGLGCGVCYRLDAKGPAACKTCGTGTPGPDSIIVMITNLCPPAPDGRHYCTKRGVENAEGFFAHFDIMAPDYKIGGERWDNPVVRYERIPCPTLESKDYATCQCAVHDGQASTSVSPTQLEAGGPSQAN